MIRKIETEILEKHGLPDELVERAYRDLARIHRWLGNTKLIVRAIRQDPLPVRRILDVGCATGLVLEEVGRRLGVAVVGADINPHPSVAAPVPILQADALRDPLPLALFRLFVAPFVCPIDAVDGQRSIRRSYTPVELRRITASALAGTASSFRLSVAPFHVRQVIDITYANASSPERTHKGEFSEVNA